MLQEVLLALSGHPSPIFGSTGLEGFPLVTPAESALLRRLGRLAGLNRALRSHLEQVLKLHPSPICRTVANAVRQTHLTRFQNHILDVERQILTKDASRVGAYNIVPLASLLSDFEPWIRSFEWLWDLTCSMMSPNEGSTTVSAAELTSCTSAALIDRLSRDTNTGYPDIRVLALELLSVAERSWLRQLIQWFLQAAHSSPVASDFFIESDLNAQRPLTFNINQRLAPNFITKPAAESVLFIGKMLAYLAGDWAGTDRIAARPSSKLSGLKLVEHFHPLMLLDSPMVQTQFSSTIGSIRTTLSTQVVDGLLPVHKILDTVIMMRDFFLLGRPSFADALVGEADIMIFSRTSRTKSNPELDLATSLAGITMKESEVGSVLSRTWSALAPWIGKEATIDASMEWARENLHLHVIKDQDSKRESPYNDLLLATPTRLGLRLLPPLDLFLTKQDVHMYSMMHTYLQSIRRGHLHITDLWRQTKSRKEHPAPVGPPTSNHSGPREVIRKNRQKFLSRMRQLRAMWKIASVTAFVLSELGNFMAVEVTQKSWEAFQTWLYGRRDDDNANSRSARPSSPTRTSTRPESSRGDSETTSLCKNKQNSLHDPEVLSQAHRRYLQALRRALLLANEDYNKALRSLLTHIDHLVAVVVRLQEVQHKVDLLDEGVLDEGTHDYVQDERVVTGSVSQATTQLGADLSNLMTCLRTVDSDRLSSGPEPADTSHGISDFRPWAGGGVDRLLMRLDLITLETPIDKVSPVSN